MILGYEAPVDIPVLSIYDKPMMQMYILALLKDYEQGVAEQKEFLSNFGNFTSPIAADVDEWNNNTIIPIQEFLALNPNALRSVEGRAALSRFIATRPYGDLAKLRQSAENAKSYKKAYADLYSQGLIDPAMAKKLDGDLSNWNTLQGDGMWDTLAPTRKTTVEELMAPYVQQLKQLYRRNPKKSNKYVDVYDVEQDRIDATLTDAFRDWENDPRYRYLREASGLTKEEFERQARESFYGKLGEERRENIEQKARSDEQKNNAAIEASKARANYYNKKADLLDNANNGVSSDWHNDKANEGFEKLHPGLRLPSMAQDLVFNDKTNQKQFSTMFGIAVVDRMQAKYGTNVAKTLVRSSDGKINYNKFKREDLPINFASGTMTESEFKHLMNSQNKFSISKKQGDTTTNISGYAGWTLDSEAIKSIGTDYEMQERDATSLTRRQRKNGYGGISVSVKDQIAKQLKGVRGDFDFDHATYSINYVGGPNYHRQVQQDKKAHTVVKVMLTVSNLKAVEEDHWYTKSGAYHKELETRTPDGAKGATIQIPVWMDMDEYVPAYGYNGTIKGRTTFNQNQRIRKDEAGIGSKGVNVRMNDFNDIEEDDD